MNNVGFGRKESESRAEWKVESYVEENKSSDTENKENYVDYQIGGGWALFDQDLYF